MIQVFEAAQKARRLRFTAAVFHHLSAVKIQRALRAHWALESAKRQIHSVISIQVQQQRALNAKAKSDSEQFPKYSDVYELKYKEKSNSLVFSPLDSVGCE